MSNSNSEDTKTLFKNASRLINQNLPLNVHGKKGDKNFSVAHLYRLKNNLANYNDKGKFDVRLAMSNRLKSLKRRGRKSILQLNSSELADSINVLTSKFGLSPALISKYLDQLFRKEVAANDLVLQTGYGKQLVGKDFEKAKTQLIKIGRYISTKTIYNMIERREVKPLDKTIDKKPN